MYVFQSINRMKMGATLTERYDMKERGTKRLTHDFEKLRKDLKKVYSLEACLSMVTICRSHTAKLSAQMYSPS